MLSLLERLQREVEQNEPHLLEHGIHLIVQQVGATGELIIGDSHHYANSVSPFSRADVDDAILRLAETVLNRPLTMTERWQGVYASGPHPYEIIAPAEGVTGIVVTSGIGMSIAFELAERVLNNMA
jgi:hypothetical protein